MKPLNVAIVFDFLEENWPSMERVGRTIFENVREVDPENLRVSPIRPRFVRRFTRASAGKHAFNADRVINRMVDYPRQLRPLRGQYDAFHIVDHSYAHLVHALPPGRALVSCHDLDTFRSVLEPDREPRSALFRAMTRKILSGLANAAKVICNTNSTREQLLRLSVAKPERLVVVRYGIDPVFTQSAEDLGDGLNGQQNGRIDLLHVGSTIPRKRIDLLLPIFAGVRKVFRNARLTRVGGPFTPEQSAQVKALGLADSIDVTPRIDDAELARLYRQSALTLLPSDAEGCPLPVMESLACGTPVVGSDIAGVREAGGEIARYCPVGDVPAWVETIAQLLRQRAEDGEGWNRMRRECISYARQFIWEQHARLLAELYREVAAA